MKSFKQFNEDAKKNADFMKSLLGKDFSSIEDTMRNVTKKSKIHQKAPAMVKQLSGMANKFKLDPKKASKVAENIPKIVGQRMNLPTRASQMSSKIDKGFNKLNKKLPTMVNKFKELSKPGGKIEKGLGKMSTMINMLSQ
tara:strand:+ start:386 stop:805 length:420 start_codon:yes stop_codon:yes gene_type:complete